jgi:hypothetical protein
MSGTQDEQAYQARIWSLISLALSVPSHGNLSALVRHWVWAEMIDANKKKENSKETMTKDFI